MSNYSIGYGNHELEMPVISLIIPVYNKDKYLEELLEQLSAQSFEKFECILIDDGSTDQSGFICDSYHDRDSRFIVWHIPKSGVSHARNYGIDRCHGQYITFIDADDLIDKDYVLNLYKCISLHSVDIVISGVRKFEGSVDNIISENVLPYKEGEYRFSDLISEFPIIQKKTGIYGVCAAKIFSKSLLGNIRFDERLNLAEDFDFYLKLYERTEVLYVSTSILYYYRIKAENSSFLCEDKDIDYYAQFIINLRYYKFLNRYKVWRMKDIKIVSEQIRNYAYLGLLYAAPGITRKCFKLFRKHRIIPYYHKEEIKVGKKIVMLALDHNVFWICWIYFKLYYFGRYLKRSLKIDHIINK